MTSFQYIRSMRIATVLFFIFMPDQRAYAEESRRGYNVVDRPRLLQAMRGCSGYDITATTNGARFQVDVVLHLVRQAMERDPHRLPLFIDHGEWFRSFLEVTGLTEETAPLYALVTYRYGQNLEVDYRMEQVVRGVIKGPQPQLAMNLRLSWEDRPGGPDRYSYLDTLSSPHFRVTHKRVVTYRLLDFGDWALWDEIEGVSGRPESGVLALLFLVIGESRITHSRMAIAADGFQVWRTKAKKAFMEVTTTVSVHPDGKMVKDVPDGRPDLLELEKMLKQPLEVDYVELPGTR